MTETIINLTSEAQTIDTLIDLAGNWKRDTNDEAEESLLQIIGNAIDFQKGLVNSKDFIMAALDFAYPQPETFPDDDQTDKE